jgi:hypothetical protein
LRAIHAAGVNCVGKKRCYPRPVRPHDIACNALPCSFTPLGLPPQHAQKDMRPHPILQPVIDRPFSFRPCIQGAAHTR